MSSFALNKMKGLVFDLDGVMYIGDRVIDGAVETIEHLKKRNIPVRFTTNTTTRSLRSLHKKLTDLGLPIAFDEVFGTIRATQHYLRKAGNPRCYLLISDDPREDFAEFKQVDKEPTHVVVGDTAKNWDSVMMQRCFEMVMAGAELVALQKGRYWQTEQGLQVDIGAFVAGLEYVTRKEAVVIGKPSRAFFQLALTDMKLKPHEVAMIGDDIFNDVEGAQKAGMKGVQVRTGKFREETVRDSGVTPDLIIDSVVDLRNML